MSRSTARHQSRGCPAAPRAFARRATLHHRPRARARETPGGASRRRDELGLRRLQRGHVSAGGATALGLRPHHDEATERHDDPADPDPHYQRIEADPKLGGLLAHTGEHHVQIHLRRRLDSDLSGRLDLRLAVVIEVLPLLARDYPLGLAVSPHLEPDAGDEAVQRLRRGHSLAHEPPTVTERIDDLLRLAGAELDVVVALEREP